MSDLTNYQIKYIEEDLIRDKLNPALSRTLANRPGVLIKFGNIALVDAYNDGSTQSLSNTVVVSGVNLEEEKAFKNQPRATVQVDNNGVPDSRRIQPSIYFNLYLLFSANFNTYSDGLKAILAIADFFRTQHVFILLHSGQEFKLIFDLCTLGLQDLNNLWSFLGGKSMPCLLYKVRLVEVPQTIEPGGGLIEAVRRDENNMNG